MTAYAVVGLVILLAAAALALFAQRWIARRRDHAARIRLSTEAAERAAERASARTSSAAAESDLRVREGRESRRRNREKRAEDAGDVLGRLNRDARVRRDKSKT